ncbi:calcium-binding protein [Antarctobacter sp.]|uniref:calcium-binding protein n=1 Tax=Antarctobacter sp. TaxID=1872577 RepID=UPI002B26620C|nr:calcium-binding protein [Antarctobacter sp.]
MIAYFVLAGQSNIDQWFSAGGGSALDAFRETFLALNPQYTDVQFFDAARGGSAMLAGSASQYADSRAPDDPDLHTRISENHWYDETNGTAGPNLTLFTDRLRAEVASGTVFLGVIWAQGEADTTYVGAHGGAAYADGLSFVLDQIMEASGAPRVWIQSLGDRAFYSPSLHGGTEAIRAAQQQVADSSDAITLATAIYDLDLRDSVHLTDAGYETAARRMAIAISTGEVSPAPAEAALVDATTLLVQLDLTPGQVALLAIDPDSLSVFDNGVEIPITSATLNAAGLLRITTETALTQPTVSYGAASETVSMQGANFIYVSGPHATVPVLPFSLTVNPSRLTVEEQATGLHIQSDARSESLTGLSGDDTLIGNAGHDTLFGGWGRDLLIGGDGKDTFVLGADGSLDTVVDFDLTQDALGLPGTSAADVSYVMQADGLEVVTAQGQHILLQGIALDDADRIVFHTLGSDAANTLTGHQGADRIFALGGNDTIDSGAGTDRITTGDGADVVMFGSGYDTNVVYDFDTARDSIQLVGVDASDLTFRPYKDTDLELRTPDGDRLILRNVSLFEATQLTLIDAPQTVGILTGTKDSDILHGTALDELIEGLGGTDRLYGGGGADVFVFREGSGLNVVYDYVVGEDRILVDPAEIGTLMILPYGEDDAEIRLASGDRMVLRDVDVLSLTAEHLLVAVPDDFL